MTELNQLLKVLEAKPSGFVVTGNTLIELLKEAVAGDPVVDTRFPKVLYGTNGNRTVKDEAELEKAKAEGFTENPPIKLKFPRWLVNQAGCAFYVSNSRQIAALKSKNGWKAVESSNFPHYVNNREAGMAVLVCSEEGRRAVVNGKGWVELHEYKSVNPLNFPPNPERTSQPGDWQAFFDSYHDEHTVRAASDYLRVMDEANEIPDHPDRWYAEFLKGDEEQ